MVDYLKIASLTEFNDCRNNTYIQHLGETYGQSPSTTINNVDFTCDMDFSHLHNKELSFNNCKGLAITLKSKASFKNCKFKEIDVKNVTTSLLELKSCIITTLYVGCNTKLINCTVEGELQIIEKPNTNWYTKIEIQDRTKIGTLIISNILHLELATDKTNTFTNVRIEGPTCDNISFKEDNIGNFSIRDITNIACKITLENISTLKELLIEESTLDEVKFKNSKVDEVQINNTKSCNLLKIENSTIGDFILKDSRINSLKFNTITIENLLWYLKDGKIGNWQIIPQNLDDQSHIQNFICIGGTIPSDTEVNFTNIAIESIILWNVFNLGRFVFSGITGRRISDSSGRINHVDSVITKYKKKGIIPESLNWNWGAIPQNAFYIINSDWGKAIFFNCTFKSMNLFMVGAKINEINISDSEWPQKLYTPSEDITTNLPRQYAQLRKIHETVGDTVKAGMYQAEELNAFHQSLKFIKGHRAEKFNLWLNKYTNYFGQDYVRAFCVTIISSLFFYTLYCLSLGFSFDIHSKKSLDNFWNIAANFLEFINPIHKADYIASTLLESKEEEYLKPFRIARLIDILSRMLNGYFIYQFIQAFRKYGKR